MDLSVVILAAGQGTRMKSDVPKVLHPLVGRAMVLHALDTARQLMDALPVLVVGHGAEAVLQVVGERAVAVEQREQLGTGHAVLQARDVLRGQADLVLVSYADMPLLTAETLSRLVQAQELNSGPITMLTLKRDQPQGFGRVVRDGDGAVVEIVEESVANPEQLAIRELNAGVYCFQAGWLWEHVDQIPLTRLKGEYYLTDLVGMAVEAGLSVEAVICGDPEEALGINTRVHLAEAERLLRRRINERWMMAGVTMVDPSTTYIDTEVVIGRDTTLRPHTHLRGNTTVGERCVIGPNTVIADSAVGDRCAVLASVVEQAVMENGSDVGPFAHLRRGTRLCEDAHVGNFGELKQATLGPAAKMGHFSYLGDAEVGARANIGAGTITCNYDGQRKHKTVIGEDAFIGSATMLVAPVHVGKGARTGAGSVITQDVPAGALAYGVPARVHSEDQERMKMNGDVVEREELIEEAAAARNRAYAPYSGYDVGAALLGQSGRVYTGCNVENAVYPLSMCAERAAVITAVCAGERAFRAIAVVTENGGPPCGSCRQVLREFGEETLVLIADGAGSWRETTVGDLLPDSFSAADLR